MIKTSWLQLQMKEMHDHAEHIPFCLTFVLVGMQGAVQSKNTSGRSLQGFKE
jgi:hypothetical protein